MCVKFLSQSTDANKDYTVLVVSITNIIESKIFAKFWDAVFLRTGSLVRKIEHYRPQHGLNNLCG